MSAHTPGPWEWDGNVCGYDQENGAPWLVQAPWNDRGSKNILTGSIKCNNEADARLISAAPDLLEALVDVMFRHVPFSNKEAYAEKARAAILKATGEQA